MPNPAYPLIVALPGQVWLQSPLLRAGVSGARTLGVLSNKKW